MIVSSYNQLCRILCDEEHAFQFGLDHGLLKREVFANAEGCWSSAQKNRKNGVQSCDATSREQYADTLFLFCTKRGFQTHICL